MRILFQQMRLWLRIGGVITLFGPCLALAAENPSLTVQLLPGSKVIFQWPTNFTQYHLERTDMLAPATNWQPVADAPATQGPFTTVTQDLAGASGFFRLASGNQALTTNFVVSATVSYLNSVPGTIPAGISRSLVSATVSYLNALPTSPPAGTLSTVASAVASYLDAAPPLFSGPVFLVSPVVSYENQ